jgi:hypothetical protein
MLRRFLPSGRVRYFPSSDHLGDGRVVDEDIDPIKPVEGSLHRVFRTVRTRDVQLYDDRVCVSSEHRPDLLRVPSGGDDGVAGSSSAAFAMSTPMPRPAPVMSQIFLPIICPFSRYVVAQALAPAIAGSEDVILPNVAPRQYQRYDHHASHDRNRVVADIAG